MSPKRMHDIQDEKFGEIHIRNDQETVGIDPPGHEGSDIQGGSRKKLWIERKQSNKRAIDLTGSHKESIRGTRPDIQGPDARHGIFYYVQNISSFMKGVWRKLPVFIRWPLVLVVALICLFMFLLFFQYRLTAATYETYDRLFRVHASEEINKEIESISKEFSQLQRNFSLIHYLGNNPFVSNQRVADAHAVIQGGKEVTLALEVAYSLYEKGQKSYGDPSVDFTGWLKKRRNSFAKVHKHLENATSAYGRVSEDIFPSQDDMKAFLAQLHQLKRMQSLLDGVEQNYDVFLRMLGHEEPRHILVLNQNQDELRAGGGFPGSAVRVSMYKGRVESWEMQDIYALDWNLFATEEAPEGINQFKASDDLDAPIDLHIRDANYYPSFHESAKKISSLMQEAGWESVDMLVGINQSLIVEILEELGGVKVDPIETKIDHKNFNLVMSSLVESKTFADTSPKDILFAFSDKLFKKIRSKNAYPMVFATSWSQLDRGEILIASTQEQEQNALDNLTFFERWKYDPGDWIYPVFTSVSKNKSDRHMSRDFTILQSLDHPCLRSFQLVQSHDYDIATDLEIEKLYYDLGIETDLEALKHVQGKGINRQYIRLILPPGSHITKDFGFDLDVSKWEDLVQVAWYQTTPTSQKSDIYFEYEVSYERCQDKTWMYKQPGLMRATYHYDPAYGAMESHVFE